MKDDLSKSDRYLVVKKHGTDEKGSPSTYRAHMEVHEYVSYGY